MISENKFWRRYTVSSAQKRWSTKSSNNKHLRQRYQSTSFLLFRCPYGQRSWTTAAKH